MLSPFKLPKVFENSLTPLLLNTEASIKLYPPRVIEVF